MPRTSRVRSLDGLRGLAAVSVVIGHVVLLFDGSSSSSAVSTAQVVIGTTDTPFYALWNGRGAVLVFFVLSGYVLTLPFASATTGFGWSYVVKRWMRIGAPYLVMAVVVLVSAIGLSRLPSQSTWPSIMFDRGPSLGDAIEWGTLIGLPSATAFNSVVWTLAVELRLSMLLPFVVIAFRRFGVGVVLGATIVLAVSADVFTISQPYAGAIAASMSVPSTLHFLPLFAAGSALAMNKERIAAVPGLTSRTSLMCILVVALAFYVYGHEWSPDVPIGAEPTALPLLVTDALVGFGAVLLVGVVAAGLGARALASRPLLALGHSSYSLYLWHLPVLVASSLLLTPEIGMMAAVAVGIVVTAIITWLSYKFVEAPVQRRIRTSRVSRAASGTPAEDPQPELVSPSA